MDGFSRYNQIQIWKEHHYKTSFTTPWGTFAYRVMPFGLKKCWIHLPTCHDILFPWFNSHHLGLLGRSHRSITKTSTTYRRLAASLFMLPQVQNSPQSPQVHFLCPSRLSSQIHHISQTDNGRSPQSLGYPWSFFPQNSALTTEPPRKGKLPSLLCTRVCNKIFWIHLPATHKNPL